MRKLLTIVSLLLISNQLAFAEEKAGLGFEFGTSIHSYSVANFSSGGSNYFRLKMNGEDGVNYFLHNESGSVSGSSGDSMSVISLNVKGVGVTTKLSKTLKLDLMVGNATTNGVASTGTGTNAVTAIQSVAPIADIGIVWIKNTGKTSINLGTVYRYHNLATPITFTDSAGKTGKTSDMSSLNINIGVSYGF